MSLGNITVDPDQPIKSPGIRLCAEVIDYASANPGPEAKSSCKIDAIPSVEFDKWPNKGRTHKPDWIPTKIWDEACSRYHLIPKCHHSGQFDLLLCRHFLITIKIMPN